MILFFSSLISLVSIDIHGLIVDCDFFHVGMIFFETDPLRMIEIYELGIVLFLFLFFVYELFFWNYENYDRVLCLKAVVFSE